MTTGSELFHLTADLGNGLWFYELSSTAQKLGNSEDLRKFTVSLQIKRMLKEVTSL